VDRFGPAPREVEHLLEVVRIKLLCREANVEKIDAGPKGAVISLRENTFANPDRLVAFIRDEGRAARVRPDMKVVFFRDWEKPEQRLRGTAAILRDLAALAQPAAAA
jgi:transcription-repair coupling factor (superfamily II helicase)